MGVVGGVGLTGVHPGRLPLKLSRCPRAYYMVNYIQLGSGVGGKGRGDTSRGGGHSCGLTAAWN